MRRSLSLSAVLAAGLVASMVAPALAKGPDGSGEAVPAATLEFEDCEAKFVRSASNIVNETERVCDGAQNPWTTEDVWLQFRPLDGRPDPSCDPEGLVHSFAWQSNAGGAGEPLADYLPSGTWYNACVYLVEPVVASGTLDSGDSDGIVVQVPADLDGRYHLTVSGTWQNGPWWLVDAVCVQQTAAGGGAGDTSTLVWKRGWPGLGSATYEFGDVLVDGASPWMDLTDADCDTTTHTYTTTIEILDGDMALRVYDTNHSDNVGALNYSLTFAGR